MKTKLYIQKQSYAVKLSEDTRARVVEIGGEDVADLSDAHTGIWNCHS